ncbi:WXG100 family type VII secretion target [Nocardia caishijiensis]|uniref:Outer membrane channel protein CpnT-like N-terminal domain-containing protein n=1 Tax=Nocardia caishijiensis TaxID=184756 RepID=A0ABQ6YNP4_9NOCA|nr:hypothetical protein [Nocardia caishijiensis]KAF0847293.1 hypothetical protein FNL39_103191 [Nocardia caishijiensis]
MADQPTAVGTFLNEHSVLPGTVDTFDDAPAPDNDLLADGTNYRDTYYQETNFLFSNVGVPRIEDKDGGTEANAGILKGTLQGDTFENGYGLYNAFANGGSTTEKIDAITKAGSTAADWSSAVQTFGKAIKGTSALAKFDPFNFIGSQLMSWMLEHVEPMRKSLDSITGNPDMVQAYSDSWKKIADHLTTTAGELAAAVDTGIGQWTGCAAEAYRARATELASTIAEKAAVAQILADCNKSMKSIVETVRGIVVEILSSLAGMLLEMTAILIASAGTASPALIARALADISLATMSVGRMLIKLAEALVSTKTLAQSAVQLVRGVAGVESAK